MKELEDHKDKLRESLKVPSGYFKENKARLLSLAEQKKPSGLRVVWKRASVWLSAAAVVTLGLFVYFRKPSTNPDISLNDISNDTIAQYLVFEYAYGLDEPLIAEAITSSNFTETAWPESVSDDDIIDFLTDSGVDESTLLSDYEN